MTGETAYNKKKNIFLTKRGELFSTLPVSLDMWDVFLLLKSRSVIAAMEIFRCMSFSEQQITCATVLFST